MVANLLLFFACIHMNIVVVALALLVALAIVVIYVIITSSMYGVWSGEEKFLSDAKLSLWQLSVYPHGSYLVVQGVDGTVLYNGGVTMRVGNRVPWRVWMPLAALASMSGRPLRVPVTAVFDAQPAPFPADVRVAVDLASQAIAVYGDRLYAYAFKNPAATAAANLH